MKSVAQIIYETIVEIERNGEVSLSELEMVASEKRIRECGKPILGGTVERYLRLWRRNLVDDCGVHTIPIRSGRVAILFMKKKGEQKLSFPVVKGGNNG